MTPIFFITGVQRSGTTLLSFILANHPDIYLGDFSLGFRFIHALKTNYELVLPRNLHRSPEEILSRLIAHDYKGRLNKLIPEEQIKKISSIQQLLDQSLNQKIKKTGSKYYGDKSPGLQAYLPELLMLIPKAKLIHIVRDGRATALSMKKRARKHLLWSAQHWVDSNLQALQHQLILGEEQMLIIQYEQLLRAPEKSIRKICSFLNLEFHAAMLDLSQHQLTGGQNAYVKDRITSSKLEQNQGPLLQKLGYELYQKHRKEDFQPLSTGKKILLNQWTNFRAIFRRTDIRMENWQLVEVRVPFRKRLGYFLRILIYELLAKPIMFSLLYRKSKNLPD